MVNIILVRPQIPENIGFVSRCMQNMGADRLVIVDPQCQIGDRALATAASGPLPLKNHTRYDSWKEYTKAETQGKRIGFTCRSGQFRPVTSFEAITDFDATTNLAFGSESSGLTNEELLDCDVLCSLPVFGPVSSMNLSHAVMLALYIFKSQIPAKEQLTPKSASAFPHESLKLWLEKLGYDLSGKTTAYTVLRQMFQTAKPTPKQMVVLEKVLQQNIRLLN